MTTHYRIPLFVHPGTGAALDNLDLPLLLHHHGGTDQRIRAVIARDARGQEIPVQWLPGTAPSAIPDRQRGKLLLGPGPGPFVELLVLADDGKDGVAIKETPEALEIAVDGKPLATYRYNTKDPELPRPYFHPLIGPSGQTITQLGEVPGEKVKHFHHTALWIAHQNFGAKGEGSCDNWQIGKKNSSKIEHVKFDAVESGPQAGRFVEKLNWLNVNGDRILLAETRIVTIPKRPADRRVLDVEIALTAQDVPVSLNKTPYHILACRVLDAMLPKNGGAIVNSAGKKNPPDGTPADWIDISGKLGDVEQGVALFDHPDNLRHPTPCLQFAGQTIGLSPTHREPYTIEPKKSLRLRYRVLVHAGSAETAKVAEEYRAFAGASG